jgi:Flp pilus assembly protein TadD
MNPQIERHRKMVEQFPGNELARFSLGKALYDDGLIVEAREHFELALAKKPDWMVVQILIGKCALAQGDRVTARAAFEKARDLALAQHHEGPLTEMEQMLNELQ